MANLEDEIQDLREKNAELAQELQFWKVTAGQKEKEKLDLMKEINDLRLKLSRLRSGGAAQAQKLDAALQTASEEALSHLVQASGAVARTIELAKQYMQERQELDASSPRWSNLGGTPSNDKVHRVPPLLLGGQSIQPVVSLSRTLVNRSVTRSPNQNSGVTHRAVPMHMLQDVYIPLTRIDAADLPGNNMNTEDEERNNSAEDLGLEESSEQIAEESQNQVSADDLEESRGLEAVMEEDVETEDERKTSLRLSRENPLEGPSWLLDVSVPERQGRSNLEPDSTTPCEAAGPSTPAATRSPAHTTTDVEPPPSPVPAAFTPTVRRRKRAGEPGRVHCDPPTLERRHINTTGRILKVMVAKMRLSDEDPGASGDSPPKRAALSPRSPGGAGGGQGAEPCPLRFDAPSPNGATDHGVIVSEAQDTSELTDTSHSRVSRRDTASRSQSVSRRDDSHSRDRSDSDSSQGDTDARTRRNRKCVSYKEKPLNRKLRR